MVRCWPSSSTDVNADRVVVDLGVDAVEHCVV